MNISDIVSAQRNYFYKGFTRNIAFRKNALQKLEKALNENEIILAAALKQDLHKSTFESYMTEIGLLKDELSYTIKHLEQWTAKQYKRTPISQFYASSFVLPEPFGVALIMSPWNYPFLLTLTPLIGAIAAGNCVIIKPSAYAPHACAALKKMLGDCFIPEFVSIVEGGRAENVALLEEKFDYIFFTGSVPVGKFVMTQAAKNLTPVTLELGGKSPCIIDETANIPLAARRLAFGKFLNAGQTCVAPDYVLCHESVKEPLLEELQKNITQFFGPQPIDNPDYGRIINRKHYDRILKLLDGTTLVCGGDTNEKTLQISPTVVDKISPKSAVMQEEIFGPVLPVLTFNTIHQAAHFVNQNAHPLALYLFTENKKNEQYFLTHCQFGGGCINDTIIHLASHNLPFGGVGESGMGSYHGKNSFDTFTHYKSIVKKSNKFDLSVRYHPYTAFKNKLLHLFLK